MIKCAQGDKLRGMLPNKVLVSKFDTAVWGHKIQRVSNVSFALVAMQLKL